LAHEQRKLATIVFIDVVGYARLMGQNESGTHALVKTHLAERVEPAITRHGGRVVKLTGDGVLAEFGSAIDALSATILLQQGMADANRDQPEPERIVFRAGIHLGDVIVETSDLYGDAVNIAARLQSEAPPGGILISRAVREAVDGRIKAELQALGELSLKNIARPIRAFRVAWQEADWPAGSVAASHSSGPAVLPSAASPLADNPSIAVLAFRNLSGDPAREYFADGMTEDIITTLSRIPNFVVIARNSTYAYKGRSVDVRQIGSELGARYVLDGSLRIAGNTLRISCVLIEATSGKHLWAERYDGVLEDVFDLQDRITSSIVATIYPKMLGAEIARAQAKPTDNLSAYDLFLRGIAEIRENTENSIKRALGLLERAIAADPRFSSAYGYVACAHWSLMQSGWSSVADAKGPGYQAAKLAVELGKDDPVALALGGFGIAYLGGRPEEGLAHIERALTLNPNALGTWRNGGAVCWMNGQHEESIRYFERAMQLNPLDTMSFESYLGISIACFFLRRYDQALHWLERSLQQKPRFVPALVVKTAALAMDGSHPEELQAAVRQVASIFPGLTISGSMERVVLSRSADRELLETALRKAGFPD
jgi:TolB-like protein/class 3 adenylate cyclase/Tfp pilus assembly protein PilF